MGESLKKHGHDKDRLVSALICDPRNLAKILNGLVLGGCTRLNMERDFEKAEGIYPVDMFISEKTKLVEIHGTLDPKGVRCTIRNVAFY
jgi:hypothetical protein